jgi:regulator of sigma E protease
MNYLLILLVLGLLILVHEFGHYVAARALGIPVARFSVGFGPRLWGFTRGGTEYRISLIPLGGYLLPAIKTEEDYFRIPVSRRIALSLGGPAANLLLALPLFGLMNFLMPNATIYDILIAPILQTVETSVHIITSIPHLFQRPDKVAGIVGIVSQGGRYAGFEAAKLLHFSALLSVNLAVFNLLPLPVLDGGKIVMCLLEKIHPKTRRAFVPLSLAGAVVLGGLLIFATVADVVRLAA